MGTEIERKYLVAGDAWRELAEPVAYRQGYLSAEPTCTVRVRVAGERGYLTVKSKPVGAVRREFEYEIPVADAEQLFGLCRQPLIEKTRRRIPHGDLVWEVDEFLGANAGLVVAECELAAEDQVVVEPPWVGREVTGDERYYNSSLAERPFTTWDAD